MIILDTNVISEAMRGPRASSVVIAWIRALSEQPVTTVVNRAEILAGVALLPDGARKDLLAGAARAAFDTLGVCLPLLPECAQEYADIVASRRAAGRPIGGMDALIASIARVSGADLATRDVRDFEGVGVDLIDPWQT
ncbi:type II toxin-antitoxin system VapC family toxin [Occultella glacieicola]|uniref:Ribonuclease VapC n=1 Tax=Occultella glacieicola TaxID=2518684 RepID=A0ABY2E5D1_9MICO|nr:type II toxin-antitoxin system VapC family toxin [Occultella glacieicola]TDE95101.1 type II toxin-antitoxin system VapC family toxin [Occultella glacieicola]